jgi:thermosome
MRRNETMTQQIQPIFILPEGSERSIGRDAQRTNIAAAKAVAETVRTTLGPKGMDKMLVNSMGDVIITNDGYTILDEMDIEHPSAKMIVEIAKTQQDEVGDGTTTAVVVAGELLKNAEGLLTQDVHPTVIARGYRMAAEKAQQILEKISEPIIKTDVETLKKIATTAMTGKAAEIAREKLADLAVRAVQLTYEDSGFDLEDIKLEKKTGFGVEDSELVEGIVMDKERVHESMPRIVKNAKIALINKELEIKKTEIDANIEIKDPSQLQAFIDMEENMLKKMTEDISKSGANVLFCQKGIDDIAKHYLAKAGIFAVERVSEDNMKRLSKATGAKIANNLHDLSEKDLGFSGVVEEKKFGDENYTFVSKCKNPRAVTLLVRGGTQHVVDELERAVSDAIGDIVCAISVGKAVAGAGASEIEMTIGIRKFANSLSGREQLAVNAFADALEIIPRTLAENAGLDPIDVITELKSAHDKGQKWAGINVFTGKVMDAWKSGVIEPTKIKTQAIKSASEVTELILRIDDIISSSKRGGPQMPPGGMGGMPEY